MRYLIALLCPPLAILLCGKIITAILNAVVWIAGIAASFFVFGLFFVWIPYIHAFAVVASHKADRRVARQTKALTRRPL
jgi:hypothetical protein